MPPRLLIVSSLIGYVEPCGCTIDLHLGGLARLSGTIEREKAKGPTAVLFLGPYLFEKSVKAHRVPQEESKARLIGRCLEKLEVDGVVNTQNELIRGADFFKTALSDTVPDITANTPQGTPKIIRLGDIQLGVFGLVPEGDMTPTGQATSPTIAAQAASAKLRADGADIVVSLASIPRRALKNISKSVTGVDLWILGDHPREESTAHAVPNGYLIEAGDRGRNIGQIMFFNGASKGPLKDPVGDHARRQKRLQSQLRMSRVMFERTQAPSLQAKIKKIESELTERPHVSNVGKRFEYTLIPMDPALKRAAPYNHWVDEYKGSLKALNLAHAGQIQPVKENQSGYIGGAQCADCHPDAAEFWSNTRHAKAWKTLEDADKTYDAECVSCHVTGWQRPGGSILGQVTDLTNVQCEVCHGPGSRHADLGGDPEYISTQVPVTVCTGCHNEHHSPKFDDRVYRPKILGPGHGG